jgi:chromosome segregation ATPase
MKDALDEYEEDIIGGIEDDIEAVQEAEKQFQESVETWEQAGLDMESILDSIMQNNYDIIMEGLEIPLSLNEEDLRYIELRLSQIEDDMYSMSEAVALTSSELSEYKDNLRLADEALAELNRAHEAGEITDAAYQEGLGEIKDKYYDNIESLMELDKTMKEYYSDTLDMANEELSKYTDQMEH